MYINLYSSFFESLPKEKKKTDFHHGTKRTDVNLVALPVRTMFVLMS